MDFVTVIQDIDALLQDISGKELIEILTVSGYTLNYIIERILENKLTEEEFIQLINRLGSCWEHIRENLLYECLKLNKLTDHHREIKAIVMKYMQINEWIDIFPKCSNSTK